MRNTMDHRHVRWRVTECGLKMNYDGNVAINICARSGRNIYSAANFYLETRNIALFR